jgi:hypothetical protein
MESAQQSEARAAAGGRDRNVLSTDQIAAYERDGFLILPNLFSEAELPY